MNQQISMFGVALLILILITAIILAFAAGPTHPLTWALVAFLVAIPFLHRRFAHRGLLEWSEEYSVGIPSIDQQHRKLIRLINQLQTAVDYSTGEEFEREALDELVDYTRSHFSYEEELMEKNGYPEFEPHREQHRKMIAKVEEVLSTYPQDPHRAMEDALEFLREWLIHHIQGTDRQYSEFLRSKGVS